MAKVTKTEVKYGVPFKTSIGAYWLTITQIEFPASGELATAGGVELDVTKLGLTAALVPGANVGAAAQGVAPEAGETAATTQLACAVWCTPIVEASTAQKQEQIAKAWPATVTATLTGKLSLRAFALAALKKVYSEAEEANALVGACTCTVFAIGK